MAELDIKVLSYNRDGAFHKSSVLKCNSFFYDEDILWIDIGKRRYGINVPAILKLREAELKSLRRYVR